MTTIRLLTKATLLIDLLAESGPLTLAEVAKGLDEPRSSVYRIASSLEDAGYLRQTGGGEFELGPTILRLGDAAESAIIDGRGLRRQLNRVREQLGTAAFFCVPRDGTAVCIDQVDGPDVDFLSLAPGRALPPDLGAVPEVLLAFRPVAADRSEGASGGAGEGAQDADPSRGRVAEVERQRWAFDHGREGGVATGAVPVFAEDGALLGVVAAAGLPGNMAGQVGAVREVLTRAAGAVAELGGVVDPVEGLADGGGVRATPSGTEEGNQEDGREGGRGSGKRSSSVIAKAAALMRVFEVCPVVPPMKLTELLHEPVSSVYRMLTTLLESGWVEQAENRGAYRAGVKMLSLSETLQRRMDIRRVAEPVMRGIHQRTGETTFLCIRRGSRAVCIERFDGIRVNSRVLELGKSLPLHVGAAPQALLAFSDREQWEEHASTLERDGVWRGAASRAELFEELEEARRRGYVVSDNNVTPGIAAVGAPILNHRGEVVASLSVSGLREGILVADRGGATVVELVTGGARQLSSWLGAAVDRVPADVTPG